MSEIKTDMIPISEIREFTLKNNNLNNNENILYNYNFNNNISNSKNDNNIISNNNYNMNNSFNPMVQNLINFNTFNNNIIGFQYNIIFNDINNLFNQEIIFNQLKEEGIKYLRDKKNVNNFLLSHMNFGNF